MFHIELLARNVRSIRPSYGMAPKLMPKILGRVATRDLKRGEAQARNRGLTRFLVRGVEKVKASVLWYALAHNMACAWRLAAA